MNAYDTSGAEYSLTETSICGGEGTLYEVDRNHSQYAKIFKAEKRTKGREAKILEWEKKFSQGLLSTGFTGQIVLPQKCLYTSKTCQNTSTFAGYLMEKLVGFRTLQNVYTENDLNYMQKVWVARNLCILTNTVHSFGDGIIIGDYNADNVAVFMSTGTAKFIDVDSFQFILHKNNRKILCPCTVGVPEFMAPEICRRLKSEKADLESIDQGPDNPLFTKYTDYYSLAFHIFALLMNGSSPYASMANMEEIALHRSKTVSDVDIDRLKAAERGEFIFARKILFRKPPEYAPKYEILPKGLRTLFERAFIAGSKDPTKRPDAAEFYNALDEYLKLLERRDCGHYLSSHYTGDCEWCRLQNLKH